MKKINIKYIDKAVD